ITGRNYRNDRRNIVKYAQKEGRELLQNIANNLLLIKNTKTSIVFFVKNIQGENWDFPKMELY
ncbi:MAG: hypothetical protein II627_06320, partial [Lachnospiraceae bacterium]|nr:hypothetical protein [Lachnospiraceae bacterium]